jgi:hypothetical protein
VNDSLSKSLYLYHVLTLAIEFNKTDKSGRPDSSGGMGATGSKKKVGIAGKSGASQMNNDIPPHLCKQIPHKYTNFIHRGKQGP